MKPISVHVSEAHYQEFKSMAQHTGRSVAELIREAMACYLREQQQRGASLLNVPSHPSGRLLSGWTRDDIFDEMLQR